MLVDALLALLLLACVLPFYAMIRAIRVDGQMTREAWARTPRRARRLQAVAITVWVLALGAAFGIGYGLSGRLIVGLGATVGFATLIGVSGPFLGFALSKRRAPRRTKVPRNNAQ